MSYKVVFTYLDEKTVTAEINNEDIEKFMNSVDQGAVYMNDDKGAGLWIAIDKVRYFQVFRKEDDGDRVSEVQSDQQGQPAGDS